jgi:hypothetical protein
VLYIHPLNDEISQRGFYTDSCERCPRAYATVFNAILTICQQIVLGDSWGSGTITIIEQYPATSVYFAFTYVSVGMLVMNLILGVVVDVASQNRAMLQEQTTEEEKVARLNLESNVLQICKDIDASKEGHLTFDDICQGYANDPSFRFMCKQMGLSEDEFEILWQCTQKNDGENTISYAAFLTSCSKLHSGDPQFMLSYVKHYVTLMKREICAGVQTMATSIDPSIQSNKKIKRSFAANLRSSSRIVEDSEIDDAAERIRPESRANLEGDRQRHFQQAVGQANVEGDWNEGVQKLAGVIGDAITALKPLANEEHVVDSHGTALKPLANEEHVVDSHSVTNYSKKPDGSKNHIYFRQIGGTSPQHSSGSPDVSQDTTTKVSSNPHSHSSLTGYDHLCPASVHHVSSQNFVASCAPGRRTDMSSSRANGQADSVSL